MEIAQVWVVALALSQKVLVLMEPTFVVGRDQSVIAPPEIPMAIAQAQVVATEQL